MRARSRLALWLALSASPLAWYSFQLGLAMTLRGACAAAGAPLGPIWGALSILLCAVAGRFAWPHQDYNTSDRFLSRIAVLAAGLFSLAIFFQLLGTVIIPPCAR